MSAVVHRGEQGEQAVGAARAVLLEIGEPLQRLAVGQTRFGLLDRSPADAV